MLVRLCAFVCVCVHVDEAGILSALLLCLHHVRKLSTRKKMAQAKTAGSGNSPLKEGWNQILRQALAHSDDEVSTNGLFGLVVCYKFTSSTRRSFTFVCS